MMTSEFSGAFSGAKSNSVNDIVLAAIQKAKNSHQKGRKKKNIFNSCS